MTIYPVIMAGGSGTRFWPLSRKATPKQFLPLASDKPLIADTAARLKGLAKPANTFVVCGKVHAGPAKKWVKGLPPKNVLVEPAARNTAPAIGLAAVHVAHRDPQGILAVLPSDHHIADPAEFRNVLADGARLAEVGQLVTIGIQPTHPETGFGYIQLGGPLYGRGRVVRAFVEKPDLETAKRYLASGDYLWNGGIFLFRADVLLEAIRQHMPDLAKGLAAIAKVVGKRDYAKVLERVFPKLPSTSIDYGVMEKAEGIAVVPGDFGWSDLGSFSALPEVRKADAAGNVVSGKGALVVDSKGCVVLGEGKGRPLAVVGCTDMVVVDAGDAILVMPKDKAQDVRKVVEALKARKQERYL
jgi:mannose-1-phosphate guanylyltransferase